MLKSAGHKELLHAIRTVCEGEEYFSSDLTRLLLRKENSAPAVTEASPTAPERAATQPLPAHISGREMEVLRLIAQGYTNHQIGEMLFTSRRTIETHRQNLLEKTRCNNTATLIRFAASHGLLD